MVLDDQSPRGREAALLNVSPHDDRAALRLTLRTFHDRLLHEYFGERRVVPCFSWTNNILSS